jgi:hypothetical protein
MRITKIETKITSAVRYGVSNFGFQTEGQWSGMLQRVEADLKEVVHFHFHFHFHFHLFELRLMSVSQAADAEEPIGDWLLVCRG